MLKDKKGKVKKRRDCEESILEDWNNGIEGNIL